MFKQTKMKSEPYKRAELLEFKSNLDGKLFKLLH